MPIPNDPIKHVVVLMLENRSFDHVLGDMAGEVPGLQSIPAGAQNIGDQGPFKPSAAADVSLPKKFEPKHEFLNVQAQVNSGAMDGQAAGANVGRGSATRADASRRYGSSGSGIIRIRKEAIVHDT